MIQLIYYFQKLSNEGIDRETIRLELEAQEYDEKNELIKLFQNDKKLLQLESQKRKQRLIMRGFRIDSIIKAQKEIVDMKKNSITSIETISKNIASKIIENISGEKLNDSSVKAAVEELSKKNMGKYL